MNSRRTASLFSSEHQRFAATNHRAALLDMGWDDVGPFSLGPSRLPGFYVPPRVSDAERTRTKSGGHWREFDERGNMVVTRDQS